MADRRAWSTSDANHSRIDSALPFKREIEWEVDQRQIQNIAYRLGNINSYLHCVFGDAELAHDGTPLGRDRLSDAPIRPNGGGGSAPRGGGRPVAE